MGGFLGILNQQAAQQQPQQPAVQPAGPSTPGQNPPTMLGQPDQQQGQQQPQQGQSDPLAASDAYWQQQLKANTPNPPSGGPVKNLLQRFFSGMGNGMMHEAGLPTQQQNAQQAAIGLQGNASARGLMALHQNMASQYAPVPLVGMDGKPITDPQTGQTITLPANHAQTFYAGQANAAARVQSAETSHPTTSVTSDLAARFPQLAPFVNQDLPADKVLALISQAGKNETQQGIASQIQANKLDMFHQSQQYQTWKTQFEGQNKLQVAQLSAGKAPAAMMQTASFAQSGLNRLDDAQQAMQRLESRGVLGNVASNKIENWIFGNGLVDPTLPAQDKEDIGKLRAAASYTSSAAMRAHTGRTSREIYDDFKNTMGINQGPDAWKGAMQETRSMLNDYAGGATNAAIQKLRGTGPSTPPAQGGSSGRRVIDLTK
jgi:hypothetical protein